MSWRLDHTPAAIHVVPDEDLREHVLTKLCWCHPILDDDFDMISHNAMDNRELYETGERLPS